MNHRPALPSDIKEFRQLIKTGKIFAVQKWIAEGKRITAPEIYWETPLSLAVETGFHSMIEVFLQQKPEQEDLDQALNYATGEGNFENIKLLVEYGARINSVDFDVICHTGNPLIIEYFINHGIDTETDYPFARALCHPKRRYLGVYMRYRKKFPSFKRQMNLALRYHAQRNNLKWVSLLMWAGGDPHLHLPEIGEKPCPRTDTNAVEEAVTLNRKEIVDKIGIDPKRDSLSVMLDLVTIRGYPEMLDRLVPFASNLSEKFREQLMDNAIFHLQSAMEERYGFRSTCAANDAIAFVIKVSKLGARWNPGTSEIRRFRRYIYQYDREFMQHLVEEFDAHQVCDRKILLQLMKNSSVLEKYGFGYEELIQQLKSGKPLKRFF